jgi:hypothetical protein
MHNKFQTTNKSKFGSQNVSSSTTGLTAIMESGLTSAIPIWDLLNITEKEYDLAYKTPIIEKKDD